MGALTAGWLGGVSWTKMTAWACVGQPVLSSSAVAGAQCRRVGRQPSRGLVSLGKFIIFSTEGFFFVVFFFKHQSDII